MQLTSSGQTPMVTIINGGTQGLGEAVARKLAIDGAAGLVIVGRSAQRGQTLADELVGIGTPTIFVPADITEDGAPDSDRRRVRPTFRNRAWTRERRCAHEPSEPLPG